MAWADRNFSQQPPLASEPADSPFLPSNGLRPRPGLATGKKSSRKSQFPTPFKVRSGDKYLSVLFFFLHRVVENGVETVTVSENGVLKSKTINGVSQAIAY